MFDLESENPERAFPWFVRPCRVVWSFLIEEHGFSGPDVTMENAECCIAYRKGAVTVSISYLAGQLPELVLSDTDGRTLDLKDLARRAGEKLEWHAAPCHYVLGKMLKSAEVDEAAGFIREYAPKLASEIQEDQERSCLLYTSPSPRDS